MCQKKISDPYWISGFVNGEGTFDIKIFKSTTKIGQTVQLRFRIPQHERDIKLLEILQKYFNSGVLEKHLKFPAITLVIVKFSSINEIVLPFFEQYPLFGIKQLDFLDWCKIAKLMNHPLTIENLNLIKTIKSKMNTGRKLE